MAEQLGVDRARRTLAALLAVVLSAGALLVTSCSGTPARRADTSSHAAATVPEGIRGFRSVDDPPVVPAPVRLRVPSIGVSSRLEHLGQDSHRTVQVPRDWHRVGWYSEGPRPGEPGSAVMLGHVDSPSGPAVFADLASIRRGARVEVDRVDGSTLKFRVTRIEQYPRSRFPVRQVFWPGLRRELRLITCGGTYSAVSGYQDNVVVFAVLTG